MNRATLLIHSADRRGLLAGISGFFTERQLNILECRQYTDVRTDRYFMRIEADMEEMTRTRLETEFGELAAKLKVEYSIYYPGERPNMAIMVSRASHCLYDLLINVENGTMNCKVPLIVSNHPDLEVVAQRFRVPFYCFPITAKEDKPEQEKRVLEIFRKHNIDLIVLARYMQVLSDGFISHYPGRIINIHHAFLPAFQGGNPYERAWEYGVKMIGATAHYATAELDEGPIIEQDVERITHESTPEDLKEIGRDIERRVLTRAVRAHLEHRVITSGRRTVVFAK